MTSGDPYLHRVVGIITEYGYAVQYVHGDPVTGARPFAYTIGLHTRPHCGYELAVSGLNAETAHGLLNVLAATLVDGGLDPTDGMEVGGVLQDGLALQLRLVSRPEEFGIIHAIYGITPPAWQAVWPDQHGRFPDDARCRLPQGTQTPL
ncbi:DUF4262 domain-containing protein [Streptomyces sp. NPDC091215]|uniref:DUF4262 domain-containing protein n=1 Tax=Streptomyces sp. NPDC091215 TaxID=3155192 RepID=UPI00342E94D5